MKNPGARERAVRGAGEAEKRESSGWRWPTPTNLTEASYRGCAWITPIERTGAARNFHPATGRTRRIVLYSLLLAMRISAGGRDTGFVKSKDHPARAGLLSRQLCSI
jgi:hypothetical protein